LYLTKKKFLEIYKETDDGGDEESEDDAPIESGDDAPIEETVYDSVHISQDNPTMRKRTWNSTFSKPSKIPRVVPEKQSSTETIQSDYKFYFFIPMFTINKSCISFA